MRKSSLIILLVSFNLLLKINCLYGQAKIIHINRFLYLDSVLFEDRWEQSRRQLPEDKTFIDTISYRSTCILETEKDSLLIYLSERMSLHFISLHPNSRGKSLHTIRNIETSEGYLYFPSKIICIDIEGDGIHHIISVLNDAEGPIFRINIFEWNRITNTILTVYESSDYFYYPSWNPTIEREEIEVKDKNIYIPYCEGCESGVDGVLKWDTLYYDNRFILR